MLIKYNIEIALTLFVVQTNKSLETRCLIEENPQKLPTTYLRPNLTLLASANELLKDITNIDPAWVQLRQTYLVDNPDRYKNDRIITIVFGGILPNEVVLPKEYKWQPLSALLDSGNDKDHIDIIQKSLMRV